jgi:hypothetical protein
MACFFEFANMDLKVWRLHPQACRVIQAEKTLNNSAHKEGVKWCHPFSTVNRLGWWIFPPVDLDFSYNGTEFKYQLLEDFNDADVELVHSNVKPEDEVSPEMWCPKGGRTKFSWGAVEPNVLQMWTGLILQTPPGWSLQIRSPINCNPQPFHVMEGILETDWMQYDIWLNIVVDRNNELIQFRKNGWPPIAQIVPVFREAYQDWNLQTQDLNRNTPEANQVFDYWIHYNQKKFAHGGNQYLGDGRTKDSTTFYHERKRILDEQQLPKKEELQPKCPFSKKEINQSSDKPKLFKKIFKKSKD